ncbi:MAG: CvpA family protein [Moraxellaceae bacterium]
MNGLDLLILVTIALCVWRGFQLGLIRSVLSLMGWLVGLYVGSRYARELAPLFAEWIETPAFQTVVAFLLLIFSVFLVFRLLSALLVSVLQALALRPLERLAGAAFGAAKGGLIVLILISVVAPWLKSAQWWQQSNMVQQLIPYAPLAMQVSKQLAEQAWQQLDSAPQSPTQMD